MQELVDAPCTSLAIQPVHATEKVQVGQRRHLIVQAGRIGYQADAQSNGRGISAHIAARDGRFAGRRRQESSQQPHGGRLAGAVRAEQCQDGAVGDAQRDVVDGHYRAELAAQAVRFDHALTLLWRRASQAKGNRHSLTSSTGSPGTASSRSNSSRTAATAGRCGRTARGDLLLMPTAPLRSRSSSMRSAGRISTWATAVSAPMLPNQCAAPGWTTTVSPGPARMARRPNWKRIRPATTVKRSSWTGCTRVAGTCPPGGRKRSNDKSWPAVSAPLWRMMIRSPLAGLSMTCPPAMPRTLQERPPAR